MLDIKLIRQEPQIVKDALKSGAILLDFNSKLEDNNMVKDPKKIYEILKIIRN